LELAIEALETDQAERLAAASPVVAPAIEAATEAQKPARPPLPDHLPRETILHQAPHACPSCGGVLRRIGGDGTEPLDYAPRRFGCWRQAPARPRPAGCGPTFATSGHSPAPDRRRRCSSTRRTARVNTRRRT